MEESLELRGRIQWFTTMVGIKATVDAVLDKLQICGVDKVAITEFKQGKVQQHGDSSCLALTLQTLLITALNV